MDAGAAIAGQSEISPLTQIFTRSALASAMAEADPSDKIPPATQVFAPSKLTNSTRATRKVVPANGTSSRHPNSSPLLIPMCRRHNGRPHFAPRHLRGRARPQQVLSGTACKRCPHPPSPNKTDNDQSVIEISSSPSSNVNLPLPLVTPTSPHAAAAVAPYRYRIKNFFSSFSPRAHSNLHRRRVSRGTAIT